MRQKLEKWWKRIIAVGLVISLLSVGFVIYPKQQKIVLTFGMFAGNKWDVPDDNCYQMIDQVIKEFEKEYPNAKVIKLEQNYRSTKNILNAANAVNIPTRKLNIKINCLFVICFSLHRIKR